MHVPSNCAAVDIYGQGGIHMNNNVEDDVDFEFLVSYNNSSFMALHNAAQDKAATDPLPVCCSRCDGVVSKRSSLACRMSRTLGGL